MRDYNDTNINMSKPAGDPMFGTTFVISDDLLRTMHPEILGAKATKAIHRAYFNGTTNMIIEYETEKKGYRGTLNVNIKTFIFK